MTRLSSLLQDLTAQFKRAGIEDPAKEACELVCFTLGLERVALYRDDPEIGHQQYLQIMGFAKRRILREPLHYILGEIEFYGLSLRVGPGVLIPRPETELLVEEALKELHLHCTGSLKILDLCTGSGCIALALAATLADSFVYGVDISKAALDYARQNALRCGIENVLFLEGCLYEPVKGEKFDLIIANPPYIKSSGLCTLQPEISRYEPHLALDGGQDGMDCYRAILAQALKYLSCQGVVALEAGIGQAGAIAEEARRLGFSKITIKRDYGAVERIVIISDGRIP